MLAGIWGTGNIANIHAEALTSIGVKIKCAVDQNEKTVQEFAQKWNIPEYGTDHNLLLADDINCIHVCTPPAMHFEMLKLLLDKKKNFICEKPVCLDNEQANVLSQEAERKGLVCAVNFNVRFHMACKYAKQVVEQTEFGPVYLIHGSYMQEFHTLPAPAGWRYNEKLAGKMRAVTEIGSHWFDLAQYISGKKVEAVSASFGCFNPERYIENNIMYRATLADKGAPITIQSEDAAIVNVKFEGGAIGCVVLSEVSHGRINRLSLEITGYNKSLWWNSEENNMINITQKGGDVCRKIFAFGNGFTDTFKEMFVSIYKRIENKTDSHMYPRLEEASHNVQICNAVYESAESNAKWVEI